MLGNRRLAQGHGHDAFPDGVGIEIEWEEFRMRNSFRLADWMQVPDGSLRNSGIEFVSRVLEGEQVRIAIDALFECAGRDFRFEPTYRCGTHVHLSTTGMTYGQFGAMCVLYALLEPTLFEFCGEERKDNIFCVPWYKTPQQLRGLYECVEYLRKFPRRMFSFSSMVRGCNKYQACNLLPLGTQGTMEFRMAPSWGQAEDYHQWVGILTTMRTKAMEWDDPDRVLGLYEDRGLEYLQEQVGLVPVDCDDQDEATDLAYRLVGEVDDEEVAWEIPEALMQPTGEAAMADEPNMRVRPDIAEVLRRPEVRAAMAEVDDFPEDYDPDMYDEDEDYDYEEL